MNRKHSILTIALVLFSVLFAFSTVAAQDSTANPFLGIGFEQTDTGVLITSVVPNSPAAQAGLEVGDVITAVNGVVVNTDTLAATIRNFDVGGQLGLSILRNEEQVDLDVTLAAAPETTASDPRLPMDSFAYLQNGEEQVWQIRSLTENNALYEAGLRAGDTITHFNGQVYDPTAFRQFLTDLEPDSTVTLTVERGEETLEIDVPARSLEVLDRFSLGFSFSDDAGTLIPFNEFFNFEPFEFFGERDALFDMLEDMLNRYFGPEGFQFNNPGAEI
jgi:C-terminal processing protease CtpA/Prc